MSRPRATKESMEAAAREAFRQEVKVRRVYCNMKQSELAVVLWMISCPVICIKGQVCVIFVVSTLIDQDAFQLRPGNNAIEIGRFPIRIGEVVSLLEIQILYICVCIFRILSSYTDKCTPKNLCADFTVQISLQYNFHYCVSKAA